MAAGERVVVLASADASFRNRLCLSLQSMRWQVHEAAGGAAAMAQLEECQANALLIDEWLPDLEAGALADFVHQLYPEVDLLRLDGVPLFEEINGSWRHELLHAVREAGSSREWDGAVWLNPRSTRNRGNHKTAAPDLCGTPEKTLLALVGPGAPECETEVEATMYLPDLVGSSAAMRELAHLVRLVAPHPARVLIEGETGSGKELVARAVHKLSNRAARPFTALNCAAIPETLLEAELFGHTRGAFTGAVQARMGRIEAADGGTLFLDEIGELPIALQAKLLRFLENGELQRIGGNETVRVDVRVVAATHQDLEARAELGTFRADLYYRLAAFPVQVPSLRERMEDLPMLTSYLLAELGRQSPRKRADGSALQQLAQYAWPGNVRELQNVLQRAVILSEARAELTADDIVFRRLKRS